MSRPVRNRQILISSITSSTKTNNYTIKKTTKNKNYTNNKIMSNNAKILEPTDNALPSTRHKELLIVKNSSSRKLMSNSILSSTKRGNFSVNKNSILTKNIPILEDRTNSFNKFNKVDNELVKINDISLHDNKKNKDDHNEKPLYEIQILVEKCIDKPQIQKKNLKNNKSVKSNWQTIIKHQVKETNSNTKELKKKSNFKINETKLLVSNNDKANRIENSKSLPNKKSDIKKKRLRKRNISIEDGETVPTESVKIVNLKLESKMKLNCNNTESINNKIYKPIKSKNLETKSLDKVEKQLTCNKFFKNKSNESEIKPIISFIKSKCQQINKNKKGRVNSIDNYENKFTLAPGNQRKSVEPLKKQLRPRIKKNYCELSRLSETSTSKKQKLASTKNTVPIYKSIKLSQENFKGKEEIYTFPDESQDNNRKIKKVNKTVKKTTVKCIKKIKTSQILIARRNQSKDIKKRPLSVDFKEQNKKKTVKCIQPDMNPECIQDTRDSTIQEVSTIKILSNNKLDESKKINLTVTPSIPKTITSELKLFGSKNTITSKPTMQYSNMVNHSLIRKSMSPITKLVENFDAGSPWRSIDTFSRVQQIVQSTPQINKLPLVCAKKLSAPKINLNNKSISSDDTIQALSTVSKSLNKHEDIKVSVRTDHKISPRKFGTVLSNISPFYTKNMQNINKSSVKNNQQPPVTKIPLQTSITENNKKLLTETESIQKNLLEFPINQEQSYVNSKENTLISPKKFSRKKINSPSPFRFDRKHSSKKTIHIESQSKTQTTEDEINQDFKIETTMLHHGDLKPTILRQSNLNNFLNIDQMPQETYISTIHGIFNDVHSTPINGRKFKKLIVEPTIENAFGFDDSDINEISPVKNTSISIINEKQNIKNTKKENTASKIKDKLQTSSRISENPVKKPILKSVLNKKPKEKIESYINKNINFVNKNDNKPIKKLVNNNKHESTNKSVLDSISFSDTFDILSEKNEIKLPEEIPLFVDLQPVHFNEPPRRSYQKRKREVLFDINKNNFVEEENERNEPKLKKKKINKINKEERKRINEWVKNINETFEEIDHFNLIVE